MVKDVNGHFTKEEIQISRAYEKVLTHISLHRIEDLKHNKILLQWFKLTILSVDKDMEQLTLL